MTVTEQKKDGLEKITTELMLQLLKEFFKQGINRNPQDPVSLAFFFDDHPYPLASTIVQMLGSDSVQERDVIHLITMSIISELKADRENSHMVIINDATDLTKKIVERLCAPQEYHFSFPISAGYGLSLSLDIGGAHNLKIQNLPTIEEQRVTLTGSVNAIHEFHASRQIETDVKSVIGVSISLGIAKLLPIPVDEIPAVIFPDRLVSRVHIDPMIGGLVTRIRFMVPNDLDELENKRLRSEPVTTALDHRLRGLNTVLSNNSERGKELRSAARLLFDAFATHEDGMAIALAIMSMEAVLLDHKTSETVLARLSEAVAYRVGKSADKRRELRKQVKRLYEARSSFVHTGKVDKPSITVTEARDICADVLRREILDLDCMAEN